MSRKPSGEKNLIFRALGPRHEFLDNDGASDTTRDGRIASIWPFLVGRAKWFHRSLKPRERANFDAEDVVIELWTALAEKDHHWTPDRGKYITFAGTIIDRELCGIRDRARTIESPRNSTGRMKEYTVEEEAGTISPRRLKTANDIRRTGDGASALCNERGDIGLPDNRPSSPLGILTGRESNSERLDAIRLAIPQLEPFEAAVIGRLSGLWGRPQQTVFWVAWETCSDVADVREARARAARKIRKYLASIDHPVTKTES